MGMDVSVIIVNYNTLKMTSECIDSVIEKTKDITYEIILVDNGSTDGSKEYFERDSRVKYIYSVENLGFGRANNLGYHHSSGKYIFLLNSDTLLINNAIKLLFDFMESNNDVAICGGQLYNREIRPIHSYSLFYPSITWELNVLMNHLLSKIYEKIKWRNIEKRKCFKVAYITGADMMLRRSDIVNLGFFDSRFFMYFEETELSYRFDKAGKKSYFFPCAQIIHLESASFKVSEKKEKLFLKSRNTIYRMLYSPFKCNFVDWIYCMTCLTRILVFSANSEKRKYWIDKYFLFTEVKRK